MKAYRFMLIVSAVAAMAVFGVICITGVPIIRGFLASKNNRLSTAIWDCDTNAVRELLAKGTDPNSTSLTVRRETPLIDAVRFGHIEIVTLLLDKGADPNKTDAEGHGPLYYAFTSPDLIDHADKEIPAAIVSVLINHGARLSARDIARAADSLAPGDPRLKIYRETASKLSDQKQMP
jgi:hypothetical protein